MAANPIDNKAYYTDILIGGRKVPGTLKDLRGLKTADEWLVQKGIGATGASTIWRGRPPIQGIEIELSLNGPDDASTRATFDAYYDFIKFLKPAADVKPPAYNVTSTPFKSVYVRQLVYAGHTAPLLTVDKPMASVIIVNEFKKPKPILPAVPEAAKLNSDTPSPTSAQQARFVAALNRAGLGPGATP